MTAYLSNTNRGSPVNPFEHNRGRNSSAPDMASQLAYVIRDILPHQPGRIHYLTTDWNALSVDQSFIPLGTPVHPVMRRGNTWLVVIDSEAFAPPAAQPGGHYYA
ncbi:MAG: NfeD family protein [Nodosilinea sp.]